MLTQLLGIAVVFGISFLLLAIGYLLTGKVKLKRGTCGSLDGDSCSFCSKGPAECDSVRESDEVEKAST